MPSGSAKKGTRCSRISTGCRIPRRPGDLAIRGYSTALSGVIRIKVRSEPISIAAGESRPALRPPLLLFAAVAAAAFAIYAFITPRVSGMGDGSEFTLVLATNGVAHPTGYPLYTRLGHLFATLLHALGAAWPDAANAWTA